MIFWMSPVLEFPTSDRDILNILPILGEKLFTEWFEYTRTGEKAHPQKKMDISLNPGFPPQACVSGKD